MKHFYQQTNYTCGPTCMRIVLHALNKNISEQKLAKLMHTKEEGKHGTNHREFTKLAKKLKINYKEGINSSFSKLRGLLKEKYLIVICYFDTKLEEGHYAIVKRIKENRIYLIDPEVGPNHSYTLKHFRKIWHGYYTPKGWFFGVKQS